MWDAAGRWKVVWHLSVWHYQWCVSERRECGGVQTWARGGGGGGREGGWRKRVCECLCGLAVVVAVVVWGEGVISTEPHSRWCRCEWVFSVSARPGLSSSRAQVRGIHLCLTLHWGFRCLLAHYQLRAKLWTFVCIQHKWHKARPRFFFTWQSLARRKCRLWVVKVMHHHLALLITQWRRGVRCRMKKKKGFVRL